MSTEIEQLETLITCLKAEDAGVYSSLLQLAEIIIRHESEIADLKIEIERAHLRLFGMGAGDGNT